VGEPPSFPCDRRLPVSVAEPFWENGGRLSSPHVPGANHSPGPEFPNGFPRSPPALFSTESTSECMRLIRRLSRLLYGAKEFSRFRPQAGGLSRDFAARFMFDGCGHSHRFDTDLSSLAGYVIDRCISIRACVPLPIHESPLPCLAGKTAGAKAATAAATAKTAKDARLIDARRHSRHPKQTRPTGAAHD